MPKQRQTQPGAVDDNAVLRIKARKKAVQQMLNQLSGKKKKKKKKKRGY